MKIIKIVITIAFSTLLVVNVKHAMAYSGNRMPEAFSPVKWGMNKSEIYKTFHGKSIEQHTQPRVTVGTSTGKLIKGDLKRISVGNVDLKNIFKANVSFYEIKNYQYIRIESVTKWENCDETSNEAQQCQKKYKQILNDYQNIISYLNKSLKKQGEYINDSDSEDTREKIYTWKINGLKISFVLAVDDAIIYQYFDIREHNNK